MSDKGCFNIKMHWNCAVKSDKQYQMGRIFILLVLPSEELGSAVCLQNVTFNGSLDGYDDARWMEQIAGQGQRQRTWGKAGRVDFQVPSWEGFWKTRKATWWEENKTLCTTHLTLNFCDRFPGGRDPFGNGLSLHAILRPWSKLAGSTGVWHFGVMVGEHSCGNPLSLSFGKSHPGQHYGEQGVLRVPLQVRQTFNVQGEQEDSSHETEQRLERQEWIWEVVWQIGRKRR